MRQRFRDRAHAGEQLAPLVARAVEDDCEVVVLGLPRGGVPVAAAVARHLQAPLDVLVVRKLGHPSQPELGLGAVSEGGVRLLDDELLRRLGLTVHELGPVVARETAELDRRLRRYRGDRAGLEVTDRTVVLVDDGVATGGSARAAMAVVHARGAARIVVAVPVAPPDVLARLADGRLGAAGAGPGAQVVAVHQPTDLRAVGAAYDDFRQTSDDEVVAILRSHPWPT